MKATGITRKVDELGRVVIPIELRRTLGINVKDPLEIFVDEDKVVFKKYESSEEKKKMLENLNILRTQVLHEDQVEAIKELEEYLQK